MHGSNKLMQPIKKKSDLKTNLFNFELIRGFVDVVSIGHESNRLMFLPFFFSKSFSYC